MGNGPFVDSWLALTILRGEEPFPSYSLSPVCGNKRFWTGVGTDTYSKNNLWRNVQIATQNDEHDWVAGDTNSVTNYPNVTEVIVTNSAPYTDEDIDLVVP